MSVIFSGFQKIQSPREAARGGYTLVELIVAIGLFTVIMTLAAGAYFMIISVNRQAQGLTTGINNLSFALETMTRDIRTGSAFPSDGSMSSFQFTDEAGNIDTYDVQNNAIRKQTGSSGVPVPLTDSSVTINSISFYVVGAAKGDQMQPRVTIVVQGTVSTGSGNQTRTFTIETGATMRGTDL